MKNLSKKNAIHGIAAITRIAGIIALAAIIGFAMVACDNGTTPSGSGGTTPGGTTPGGNTPGGNTPGGNTPGGNTPGGNTPGGNTPGSTQPTLPILYDNGEWAAALGNVSVAASGTKNTVFIFENAVDFSDYNKLVIEGVDVTGWFAGGQLFNLTTEDKLDKWSGITLEDTDGDGNASKVSFDLSTVDFEVDEITVGGNSPIMTADPLSITKMYLTGGSSGGVGLVVDFDGTEIAATIAATSTLASVSGGTITVEWNADAVDDNTGDPAPEFRVEIELDEPVDISSGFTKFTMEWTAGNADGGNFNISLLFGSDKRLLSAYKAAGSASFDFSTDHPSWASSWAGATVGTITGIEIYSGDDTNFGSDDLVITSLSFE